MAHSPSSSGLPGSLTSAAADAWPRQPSAAAAVGVSFPMSGGGGPGSSSPPRESSATFLKRIQPFAVGGFAGCIATTCIQPVDMVKVRLQVAGEAPGGTTSPVRVLRGIIRNEGFFALYKGLDAGLIRQKKLLAGAGGGCDHLSEDESYRSVFLLYLRYLLRIFYAGLTYSTARLGLFRIISDEMRNAQKNNNTKDAAGGQLTLPLWKKAVAGLAAGALGSFIGNPADLSLVRLQADATLPPEQRRHYTGVLNALSRIIKDEGIMGLWRGSTPTVFRAMALNMGMLASNDQAKELLEPHLGTGWATTLGASAISGFFAVTLSLPFDFIKTRMQKMRPDPITGQLPYKNFVDAVVKITRKEGIMSLYTGYPTYYVRIAPHAMITLISMEYLNRYWSRYVVP